MPMRCCRPARPRDEGDVGTPSTSGQSLTGRDTEARVLFQIGFRRFRVRLMGGLRAGLILRESPHGRYFALMLLRLAAILAGVPKKEASAY